MQLQTREIYGDRRCRAELSLVFKAAWHCQGTINVQVSALAEEVGQDAIPRGRLQAVDDTKEQHPLAFPKVALDQKKFALMVITVMPLLEVSIYEDLVV